MRGTIRAVVCAVAAAACVVAGLDSAALAAPGGEGHLRGSSERAVRDSYIVVLKTDARPRGAADERPGLARRYGGVLRRSYDSALHGFEARMSERAARRLARDPAVKYVERNREVSINELQRDAPWGLDRIDGRTKELDGQYFYQGTAATVHAYVIDSGIRLSHETFGGRAVSGYDTYDDDPDADDCHGHGTHVAGTIGGREYGVAKQVRLVGVRVVNCLGKADTSSIIDGVDWVTANAVRPAVANMSLGVFPSDSLDDAVRASIASGITYGISAGNGTFVGNYPMPACDVSPARVTEAITVGATNRADARTNWSNYGECVDIFAPGDDIDSATIGSDIAHRLSSGTSMASPHVVGAAALVLAEHPTYTPQQVRDAIVADATSGVVGDPGEGSPNRLLFTAAPAKDFAMSLTPTAATVVAGETTAVRVDLPLTTESGQAVTLSADSDSRWLRFAFAPPEVDAFDNRFSDLTITVDERAPREPVTITVTATGAAVTRTGTFTLTVAPPRFALSLSTAAGTARVGTSTVTTLRSRVVAGRPGNVKLTVPDVPAGVLARAAGGLPADGTAELRFVVTPDAVPGTYPLTVTVTAETVQTITYTLTVTGPPGGACGRHDVPGLEVVGESAQDSTPVTIAGCGREASGESLVYVSAARPFYMSPDDHVALDLIAPDGSVRQLKSAGTESGSEFVAVYTVNLSGLPADGTWRLQVRNGAADYWDTVQIVEWMLTV